MTDSSYTKLLLIVDRSGSMASCAVEMRNAIDTFFKEQAANEGRADVDYVQFDNSYELVYSDRPVGEAEAVLQPRGSTALLDAVGKAVVDLGTKLKAKPEDSRPGLVQVVVVTDGYENASQEWTASKVRELIKEQTDKYNWDFVFLGANMDAQQVGASFGFDRDKSLTYDTHNTAMASASLSGYTTNTRSNVAAGVGTKSVNFTDDDRKKNSSKS